MKEALIVALIAIIIFFLGEMVLIAINHCLINRLQRRVEIVEEKLEALSYDKAIVEIREDIE